MSPTSRSGSPPDVGVIVPAAGRGERAGAGDLKQFRPIAGVPMLLRAIRPFAQHPRVAEIVVVLPADLATAPPGWLADLAGDRLRLVAGGETRAASVLAGLRALGAAASVVLVHDAARPFVSTETIEAVIEAARQGTGAIAAVPVSDTLKQAADGGRRVVATVPRDGLWRAQTPQGFPRAMLLEAYDGWLTAGGRPDPTDEAALAERSGLPVTLVPDRTTNLKVTTAEDFILAEAIASP